MTEHAIDRDRSGPIRGPVGYRWVLWCTCREAMYVRPTKTLAEREWHAHVKRWTRRAA